MRIEGVEPTRREALDPKSSMSTNSTISPKNSLRQTVIREFDIPVSFNGVQRYSIIFDYEMKVYFFLLETFYK